MRHGDVQGTDAVHCYWTDKCLIPEQGIGTLLSLNDGALSSQSVSAFDKLQNALSHARGCHAASDKALESPQYASGARLSRTESSTQKKKNQLIRLMTWHHRKRQSSVSWAMRRELCSPGFCPSFSRPAYAKTRRRPGTVNDFLPVLTVTPAPWSRWPRIPVRQTNITLLTLSPPLCQPGEGGGAHIAGIGVVNTPVTNCLPAKGGHCLRLHPSRHGPESPGHGSGRAGSRTPILRAMSYRFIIQFEWSIPR